MNSKVILTGSSGFLGSHLLAKLLSLGIDVLPVSFQKNKNMPMNYLLSNFKRLVSPEDIIVHLAAVGSRSENTSKALMYDINYKKSAELFNELQCNSNYSILVGTAAEYGSSANKNNGVASLESPLSPISDYAKSKVKFYNFIKYGNYQSTYLRLFQVYGFANHPFKLEAQILRAHNKQVELNLVHPNFIRDFTSKCEVVQFIISLIRNSENRLAEINFVSGKGTSIFDFTNYLFNSKYALIPDYISKNNQNHDPIKLIGSLNEAQVLGQFIKPLDSEVNLLKVLSKCRCI